MQAIKSKLCRTRLYAGQWLGASAGSRMVMTHGTKFIRPVFLSMVALITLKMIHDNYLKPHA
jgi:uncharacterized membrane protein YfcA